MRLIIHESRNAVWAIAPTKARAPNQPRRGFDTVLRDAANGSDILIQVIDDGAAGDILYKIVQIIGSSNAGVPCAEITQIPIVAGVEVDAIHMLEARSKVRF